MLKKYLYSAPVIEVINLDDADLLTTSGLSGILEGCGDPANEFYY